MSWYPRSSEFQSHPFSDWGTSLMWAALDPDTPGARWQRVTSSGSSAGCAERTFLTFWLTRLGISENIHGFTEFCSCSSGGCWHSIESNKFIRLVARVYTDSQLSSLSADVVCPSLPLSVITWQIGKHAGKWNKTLFCHVRSRSKLC